MTRLFRIILPVSDINRAAAFYSAILNSSGERVSPGRHYFNCGTTILACFDPRADGDNFDAVPNPDHFYFALPDLERVFEIMKHLGCPHLDTTIKTRPWGKRSFYAKDPFGNPICFVDETTIFKG